MLVFAAGLTVEGYTRGVLGENSSTEPAPGRHAGAPVAVISGGPVIRMAGSRPRSYTMPARTVALTFDDGPDPTWTPKILAVLRHYRVPGTFFLVGAHVASNPGLVQEELRDGDEIGSHTYTHLNLATAGWREDFELTLTQNALAGTADVRTRLLRMPYSSEPDALTAADWRAAERAGRDGYLVVLANLDTTDWARPGVAHIVAAATPRGRRGAIIMFHDGGGDRAQTVAALPAIITQLRARGYRFTTVTGGLLPLIAPVVDVFSIYGLVFLNPVKVTLFWLTFVLLQALAGGYALRLDGERLRPLCLLPLQQVVYRQLMYLVTIQSVITALIGTRQRWQAISRAGVFANPSA